MRFDPPKPVILERKLRVLETTLNDVKWMSLNRQLRSGKILKISKQK